ncbi:MAG: fibronectin type III domain-containing protein [Ruminococcus sp.]|nr:fibronectin type III domain-containing protein [Ruminococcus sp.]
MRKKLTMVAAVMAATAALGAFDVTGLNARAKSKYYTDAVLLGTDDNGNKAGFSSITDITGVSAVIFTFKVDEAAAAKAANGEIDFKGTIGTSSSSRGIVTHDWSFVPYKLDSNGDVIYGDDLEPVPAADVTLEKIGEGFYTATLEDKEGLFKDEDTYAKVWFDADNNNYDIELTGIVLSFDDSQIVRDLSNAKMTIASSSYTYSGNSNKPAATITYGSKTLKEGTDYTLTYKNNINAGTATVTAAGKGKYKGSISKTFKIAKKALSGSKISFKKTKLAYTGKAIKPSLTVTLGGKTLKSGTDYTLSYKNNTKVGTASVTITGKGNYSGSLVTTFTIIPKTTKIGKATSPKTKQAKVTWTKNTSGGGYQIAYSTKSSFSSKTTKSISGSSKTSVTLKSLKKGKTYYFKVRAYKTVNGTKIYGEYSAVKSVKIK